MCGNPGVWCAVIMWQGYIKATPVGFEPTRGDPHRLSRPTPAGGHMAGSRNILTWRQPHTMKVAKSILARCMHCGSPGILMCCHHLDMTEELRSKKAASPTEKKEHGQFARVVQAGGLKFHCCKPRGCKENPASGLEPGSLGCFGVCVCGAVLAKKTLCIFICGFIGFPCKSHPCGRGNSAISGA